MRTYKRKLRSKIFLSLIIVIPLIPLLVAVLLYQNPNYLSGKLTVGGQLLQPPLDGSAFVEKGKRKWLLLVPIKGLCASLCQANLFFLRQTHEALGKNRDRFERVVLLVGDDASLPEKFQEELTRQTPRIKIRTTSTKDFDSIFVEITDSMDDDIYVADPLGNIMLRHHRLIEPDMAKILLKDLKHLLRASQIG